MKARFLPSLAFVVLLSACAARPSASPLISSAGQPEIVVQAPRERVRNSLITQQTGEQGAILASATENRLVFVTQVSRPVTEVSDDLKPSGAPYIREVYILTGEAHGTHVSVSNEIVSNYGTATAHARPFDTPALRRTQQRNLLRLRTIVERQ